jgi:hypothetical protein
MQAYNRCGWFLRREIDTFLLPKKQYDKVVNDIRHFKALDGSSKKQNFIYHELTKYVGTIRTIIYRIDNYHFFDPFDFE